MMRLSTILVAAGKGSRFGGMKQFMPLCGRPLVMWAVDAFYRVSDELILVLPAGSTGRLRGTLMRRYPDIRILPGGKYRSDSVQKGLAAVAATSNYICIHDGVRPLVTAATIRKCLDAAQRYGSAVCAVPSTDTVKIAGTGQYAAGTLDRKKVWLVQTPQVFRKKLIYDAYKRCRNMSGVTDDASLVERTGTRIRLVQGEYSNIKITRRQDIAFAKLILRQRGVA